MDIQKASTPIIIITGAKSDLYSDAIQLKEALNGNDKFFEIQGADHGSIFGHKDLDHTFDQLLTNEGPGM